MVYLTMFNDIHNLRILKSAIEHEGLKPYNPPIKLSNGESSDWYVDLKHVLAVANNLKLVGKCLWSEISNHVNCKSIGGIETGSISMAAMAAVSGDDNMTTFYVRKKVKLHGTNKIIEGQLKRPAVLIDDVVTSGQTIAEAAKSMREYNGVNPALIYAVVYRGDILKLDEIRNRCQTEFRYLFHMSDLKHKPIG